MEEVFIECSPGISGDMLLGAFYDLGVPKKVIFGLFIPRIKILKTCIYRSQGYGILIS